MTRKMLDVFTFAVPPLTPCCPVKASSRYQYLRPKATRHQSKIHERMFVLHSLAQEGDSFRAATKLARNLRQTIESAWDPPSTPVTVRLRGSGSLGVTQGPLLHEVREYARHYAPISVHTHDTVNFCEASTVRGVSFPIGRTLLHA